MYFYGKINTAKFKLCHSYCETCYEYGNSNDNQKCMSCLSDYQYDYYNQYPSNCVPSWFFIDKEQGNKLIECTEANSKFYINAVNKRICFKLDYPCPEDYPYLDEMTNECKNYTIPTTLITTILTTFPTTIIATSPKTILTTSPTTILTLTPRTILTTIPTTIITTIPTTIITTTPTTIATTILTSIPTSIFTTIPITIITTIPKTTYIDIISSSFKILNN